MKSRRGGFTRLSRSHNLSQVESTSGVDDPLYARRIDGESSTRIIERDSRRKEREQDWLKTLSGNRRNQVSLASIVPLSFKYIAQRSFSEDRDFRSGASNIAWINHLPRKGHAHSRRRIRAGSSDYYHLRIAQRKWTTVTGLLYV